MQQSTRQGTNWSLVLALLFGGGAILIAIGLVGVLAVVIASKPDRASRVGWYREQLFLIETKIEQHMNKRETFRKNAVVSEEDDAMLRKESTPLFARRISLLDAAKAEGIYPNEVLPGGR